MKPIGLRLDPLDVLFFRDGRPFGEAGQATSGLPTPQVLAGALRTALLEQRGRLAEGPALLARHPEIETLHVRGPWLAREKGPGGPLEVLVPAPATLHEEKSPEGGGQPRRFLLRPLPSRVTLPGWPGPLRPLWLRGTARTERVEGFLTPAGLRDFLAGRPPAGAEVVPPHKLFQIDRRTGIGVHADRLTAEEGLIYAAGFLALASGVCLYAEVLLPEGLTLNGLGAVALGGEGRRARLTVTDPVPPPAPAPRAGKAKSLLLLTTPGLFDNPAEPWRPRELPGLVAAAVPGSVAVSGWDLARRGPKPTRFGAAPGSVYFLDGAAPRPALGSLCDRPEDARLGYGCFVEGEWTDE